MRPGSFGGIWIHLDPVLDLVLCLGLTPPRIGMGICPDIFLREQSGMIFLVSFVKYWKSLGKLEDEKIHLSLE